jgi:hypothetical protein
LQLPCIITSGGVSCVTKGTRRKTMPDETNTGGFLGQIISGLGTGGLSSLLPGLGGLFGGLANQGNFTQARDDIQANTNFRDQSADFGFGSAFAGAGGQNQFAFSPQQQMLNTLLAGGNQQLLGGGIFNDPNFQQAFQSNDIAGALGQAQGSLQQQASPTAFGGLGGLFQQFSGLGSQFANQTAQGPQDLTGGLQGQQFSAGLANQQRAGDQSGLFNQSLATQRAAATSGGLLDTAINKFRDAGFATGRSSTTGGARDQEGFLNSIAAQDLGFQNNAFGQAQAQQQFLGNLGTQQFNQGAGLLGQNLGQFNQGANFAGQFGQLAQGVEGQAFNQALQSLQQNQTAGTQRLQNAQGLFGLGGDVLGQQIGLGQAGFGAGLAANDQALAAILGLRNAESGRIGATGQGSLATAELQNNSGGGIGGFISGLFSDRRLKNNITKIGTLGGHNWYEWEWNDEAKAIGADKQDAYGVIAQEVAVDHPEVVTLDPETGYLTVNYGGLL